MIAEASSLPLEERQILADSIMKSLHQTRAVSEKSVHGLPPLMYDKQRKLSEHPAFGQWRAKKQDGVAYQDNLRSEWSL